MTTPASELLAAAALLEYRAAPVPKSWRLAGTQIVAAGTQMLPGTDVIGSCMVPERARYVALWHPGIALILAALFRKDARAWELAGPDEAGPDPDDSPSLLGLARELLAASLPELREEDLRVDEYRSGSPMRWVRITHLPTGIVAESGAVSLLRAKAEALTELRSKVAAAQAGETR